MNRSEARIVDRADCDRVLLEEDVPVVVTKGVFSSVELSGLEALAKPLHYRSVPRWLGNFAFVTFRRSPSFGPQDYPVLPSSFEPFVKVLEALVTVQSFNTIFLQRYGVGSEVLRHRDPLTNTATTIIAPFGDFGGAESLCEGYRFFVRPGDVAIQRCTTSCLLSRPWHSVSPVTKGTRYALILNTIDTEA